MTPTWRDLEATRPSKRVHSVMIPAVIMVVDDGPSAEDLDAEDRVTLEPMPESSWSACCFTAS